MSGRPVLIVVLAAGKGTRMKSQLPKVMHRIAGRSMLGHVLALGQSIANAKLAVVIGPDMNAVEAETARLSPGAAIYMQREQLGTAHAVLAARESLRRHDGDVIVLYADTPLIERASIDRLVAALDGGAGVAVLGFTPSDPTGYGRLITDGSGRLVAIREERDASEAERRIQLANSGVMAFRMANVADVLEQIGNANAKREFYLTDIVEVARRAAIESVAVEGRADEVFGVNARDELAEAELIWQQRARLRFMRDGVTLVDPETVWFSFDTRIGRDVVIEPNVVIGPGVSIEDGVEIKAFSHFEGARIAAGARIGPFSRLRPGADIGQEVHIGNFVEVKNVALGAGAKANHLAYLGDGSVGAGANIGAGTIFCNYDGFFKHRTEIGAGAFIGSNSALVAPLRIGDGAYVGSGSVITKDVAAGALALERSPQEERPGWAAKFREMMTKRKQRAKAS